jgi:hypothetical protein
MVLAAAIVDQNGARDDGGRSRAGPDYGHLDIEVSIEDPATFSKPWKVHVIWELVPSDEIQEFICENNKDPVHIVSK